MLTPRRHLVLLDVLTGLLLAIANFAVAGNLWLAQSNEVPTMVLATAAALLAGTAVALRRLWPRTMLALAVAVALSGTLWDPFVTVALVLYTATTLRPRRESVTALALCLTAAAVGALWLPAGWAFAPVAAVFALLAWLTGELLRERRTQAADLAAQQARQIRLDERLRIARELHDVVAHGMGLIAVKAAVANFVAETRPEETRAALRVIETTSKEALAETRRLLSVLRTDDLQPPDLDELFAGAREAGVQIEATVRLDDLPEALRLTVLRIVQEAVTNVIRHAAPATCQVRVTGTDEAVTIEVTDNGPGGDPRPGGHGLTGIRERVALYEGDFHAGPAPDGGFHLHATLPRKRPS
ncbi:histidine kinase [Crossiella sp. CA-258035]|uniref:sensor histidine kinase n=1 Tax=Crossiella sp. CA-258035 TaxID=2981138 RepID=UPI0024BC8727|nr:histidine kinase [Crossiella sp. CA-258035]WHT20361.1 histidine kinase [Crossiella sp. CA-258035]